MGQEGTVGGRPFPAALQEVPWGGTASIHKDYVQEVWGGGGVPSAALSAKKKKKGGRTSSWEGRTPGGAQRPALAAGGGGGGIVWGCSLRGWPPGRAPWGSFRQFRVDGQHAVGRPVRLPEVAVQLLQLWAQRELHGQVHAQSLQPLLQPAEGRPGGTEQERETEREPKGSHSGTHTPSPASSLWLQLVRRGRLPLCLEPCLCRAHDPVLKGTLLRCLCGSPFETIAGKSNRPFC